MIYETHMKRPTDGAAMFEILYESCSTASGKGLNLPAQHYVAESCMCKFMAEILLTLKKKKSLHFMSHFSGILLLHET